MQSRSNKCEGLCKACGNISDDENACACDGCHQLVCLACVNVSGLEGEEELLCDICCRVESLKSVN